MIQQRLLPPYNLLRSSSTFVPLSLCIIVLPDLQEASAEFSFVGHKTLLTHSKPNKELSVNPWTGLFCSSMDEVWEWFGNSGKSVDTNGVLYTMNHTLYEGARNSDTVLDYCSTTNITIRWGRSRHNCPPLKMSLGYQFMRSFNNFYRASSSPLLLRSALRLQHGQKEQF